MKIMQHIEIKHHKLAIDIEIRPKVEKNQLQISSHLFNLKEKIPNQDLIPFFRNVYFLAKENVALIKSKNLHKLVEINGSSQINVNYRCSRITKEFVSCIAADFRVKVMDDIKKSPFIGIQADESIDVTFRSHLALAIQYISKKKLNQIL